MKTLKHGSSLNLSWPLRGEDSGYDSTIEATEISRLSQHFLIKFLIYNIFFKEQCLVFYRIFKC